MARSSNATRGNNGADAGHTGTAQDSHLRGDATGRDDVKLQIVGAGPAGMSLVLALCNRAAAGDAAAAGLLEGLVVFEADAAPGGKMGHYRINANTSSTDVVRGILEGSPFAGVRDAYLAHPETRSELIPLPTIDKLMVAPLAQSMSDYLGSRLRSATAVSRIAIDNSGITSFDAGDRRLAGSDNLVICCGAREVPLPELLPFRDRWEGSGQFLLRESPQGLPYDRSLIVIVGASHSAFSCAWRLLHDPLFEKFARDREIVILQRRERIKLRCTVEFAAAHGIAYDADDDVCPTTGLVFRNAGLRKDAKMLYLRIRDGEEDRVRLVEMDSLDEKQDLLERAGLILQATGFASNPPPVEIGGCCVAIGAPTDCGELRNLETGDVIPGLFGMGLGFDILPAGAGYGEASFSGGLHGFQSYPLTIAPRLIDKITAKPEREEKI